VALEAFIEQIDEQYGGLMWHTKARWLSREVVFKFGAFSQKLWSRFTTAVI
jgi:hypothetical protein